jgi:hypothetical protein
VLAKYHGPREGGTGWEIWLAAPVMGTLALANNAISGFFVFQCMEYDRTTKVRFFIFLSEI